MTSESATQPQCPARRDSHVMPEVVYWRAATDNGRDDARARALRAGTVKPAPGFEAVAR